MARLSHLTVAALAISLSACVAGPPPEIATPTPELPEALFYHPDRYTSMNLARLMPTNDAAFLDLASAALEGGPSLAEALARIDAARAGAARAGADRLPQLRAERSVTATRTNPNQFGSGAAQSGFVDTERVAFGSNLIASWDADIFGQLRARERAAIARIEAATASAAAVRIALLAEIAASVTDWRVLNSREASIDSDVAAAQQLAALAKTREDAGIAPGFDRVRAEATATASQSRLIALESDRARLIGRLVTLTGLEAAKVRQSLDQGGPSYKPWPAPTSLPSALLANRPDVLAADARLAASDAELAATARARFPKLSLSAVVGLLSFDLGDAFDSDSLVGSVGANVAATLFDFGRIEAEIDGAAANKRAAFQAYRGAVFQALGDAEAAYGLAVASDRQMRLAAQERDQLQRAAQLANDRYRAGLASFLEVLEARRAADASGERAAIALGQSERSRIVLWQALGGDTADYIVELRERQIASEATGEGAGTDAP